MDIEERYWQTLSPEEQERQTKLKQYAMLTYITKEPSSKSWWKRTTHIMTTDEAIVFTHDKRTERKQSWMYILNRTNSLIERDYEFDNSFRTGGNTIWLSKMGDNGKMDEVIADLGLHPLTEEQIYTTFIPLGIAVR